MSPNAQAFIAANAESPVVYGAAREPDPRKPARGASYRLKDGRRFILNVQDCKDVGMPRWDL